MSQSLSAIYLHLVFSTKNRVPHLREETLRERVFQYLGGITNTLQCPVLRVGGHEDHIHMLARFGRTISVADWVKEIKRISSGWFKEKEDPSGDFAWQSGYGCFSVSASKVQAVTQYIDNQKEHHKTVSFQDEYREFLKKYGMEWDERYVWD